MKSSSGLSSRLPQSYAQVRIPPANRLTYGSCFDLTREVHIVIFNSKSGRTPIRHLGVIDLLPAFR